jgi:UDPglucose--hexose-1-phosphate uridylyltransferase
MTTDPSPIDPSPIDRTGADRVDVLTGDVTHIVGTRQGRPNLPPTGCPFCVGGIEAPDPYDVRWFPNRWPPLSGDRAEIVLYTSDHDATFASLGVAGARRVVDLWADRTEALGRRDDVAYVLVFENRGPEVGATIAHPHGQIYGYGSVPPRALDELERGDVVAGLGPEAPGDRLVAHHGDWRAWVPHAATWPYAMVVAPEHPVPDLPALDDGSRDDLAGLLVDVLGRLDRLFDEPMPYMLWFHQRPSDGANWPNAWLHAHISPLYRSAGTPRFVAAAELGGHVYFNPVDPVDAADALRRA